MKNRLIIVILLFVVFKLFSFSIYTPEKIRDIEVGSLPGELGFLSVEPPVFAITYPNTFAFDHNNLLYVFDGYNKRINIYDRNINYQAEIKKDNYYLFGVSKIKFNSSNEMVFTDAYGLTMFDMTMNPVFSIDNKDMPTSVINAYNFFPYKEYIFYYNNSGTILCLNKKGKHIEQIEISKVIKENFDKETTLFKNNSKLRETLFAYIKENNLLLLSNKILNTNKFKVFGNYFTFMRNLNNSYEDKYLINYEANINNFIGFDDNCNMYWDGVMKKNGIIVVYNYYGYVIDCIKIEKNYEAKTIAPNGDIYYMEPSEKGTSFFRIRNTWDPIDSIDTLDSTDNPTTPDTPTTPTTPAKAFDNNPKTGWLEGVNSPGTGESITLKLNKEITVDEIAVAPGYFDSKWWKSNNRVKSLRITYGGTSRVLNFKDEMQMQKIKLAKEIRFSGITFEITEVYLSGKDNDTGISEIEFYYKGEKVAIDMSGMK
ncbi:MAG: hypothetical protein JXJ04_04315 [Spirochaetales bacterium]|nr:hypothetical protein [Spirochaetales bacterium]